MSDFFIAGENFGPNTSFSTRLADDLEALPEVDTAVRYRFANTRAVGGTPMADGIQFGLQALSLRKENHRFMFVITDGAPDGGHKPVIKWQIKQAQEAGVHIIGVGFGGGARYVQARFPDSTWAPSIDQLPKRLVAKLNELLDFRNAKRGRKIKLTG